MTKAELEDQIDNLESTIFKAIEILSDDEIDAEDRVDEALEALDEDDED